MSLIYKPYFYNYRAVHVGIKFNTEHVQTSTLLKDYRNNRINPVSDESILPEIRQMKQRKYELKQTEF